MYLICKQKGPAWVWEDGHVRQDLFTGFCFEIFGLHYRDQGEF